MSSFFTARNLVRLALLVPVGGCGQSIDVARWSEEVLLHDGRVIVVERIARAYPRPLLSDTRGADIDFELHYEPLGIHWKGIRQLDTLEVIDGVAYMLTGVGNEVEFCKGKRASDLPTKVWRQQGKTWLEVDANTFPTGVAYWNLYRGYWGNKPSQDAKGLVTWDFKAGYDAYPFVDAKTGNLRRAYTVEEFFRENKLTCARFQTNSTEPG